MPAPLILTSPRLSTLGVPHGFSTRIGGVSAGIFASLNLGNPSELPAERRDPPSNIRANFGLILGSLGCGDRQLVEVHQVHSAGVHTVLAGAPSHPGDRDTKADAIVTDDPRRVLAVRVADCTPVLLSSADGRTVAAVHAGWRGVVSGVLPNTIGVMRDMDARGIVAAIGPCIGPDHFEVGEEVAAEFSRVFGESPGLIRRTPGRKPHIDLKAALALQLRNAGITAVDISDACTYRDHDRFYSHRRDQGLTGRSAGLIGPRA
jgi:YfiH family protein